MMERDDERAQLRYAAALAEWGEAGGYEAEVHWDACTVAAFGIPYDQCRWRDVGTLSGGEQKRLVLESLLRGNDGVLLLDEPDNYLDVPGKRWLEQQLASTPKTVLLVSHDRELLAACAQRIVTVEDRHVWVHGGGFGNYAQARADRISRLEELRRRWDEEHEKLKELVRTLRQKASYNDGMASRYQAAVTRLRRFEDEGPPQEAPREQNVKMRLRGGRTGKRAVMCENLVLTGNTNSFGTEIWFDDRVAILGANGSGKSSFLRLLAGEEVPHEGQARLGARVVPGMFAQTHTRPDLAGRTPVELLMTEHALLINEAMSALSRYELQQLCPAAVRHPVRRPAGQAADPAARAGRLDAAAARRADRQPRPAQRRGAAAGPGVLPGHGARGHARPLVRPVVRAVPHLHPGRQRPRGHRTRLGLSAVLAFGTTFTQPLCLQLWVP